MKKVNDRSRSLSRSPTRNPVDPEFRSQQIRSRSRNRSRSRSQPRPSWAPKPRPNYSMKKAWGPYADLMTEQFRPVQQRGTTRSIQG